MIISMVLHYALIHRNFIQLQTQCVTHPDYPIIQLFVFESYRNDIDSSAFKIRPTPTGTPNPWNQCSKIKSKKQDKKKAREELKRQEEEIELAKQRDQQKRVRESILGKRKGSGKARKAKKQKKADMASTPAKGKKMKTPSILSLFKKRNKKPVPLSPTSAMKDLSLDWVFNIESKRTFKSYMPCRTVYIFLKRTFLEKYCLVCFDIPRPAAGAYFFWIFGGGRPSHDPRIFF